MIRFSIRYFRIAVLLFMVEAAIAMFVHGRVVRPYGGDFLVVGLLYCLLRSFFNLNVVTSAIVVLLFSYIVEVLQYFQLVKMLGLETSVVARTVLGSTFEWGDMLAYTLGVLFVLLLEKSANCYRIL